MRDKNAEFPRLGETMRHTLMGALWILLAMGIAVAHAQPPQRPGSQPRPTAEPPAPLRPHFFPSSRFVLPMTHAQGNAQRVELLLSQDEGRSWQLIDMIQYRDQRPSASQFTVEAAGDGNYWFTVRTLFPNRIDPPGRLRPEIFVQVDSRQPELSMRVLAGGRGELVAQWEAADANLAPKSLKIEYRAGERGEWVSVPVRASSAENANGRIRGESVWWPRSAAEGVTVRAEVRDLAGNRRQVQQWHPLAKVADQPQSATPDSAIAAERSGAIAWPSDRRAEPGPPARPNSQYVVERPISQTPSASRGHPNPSHPKRDHATQEQARLPGGPHLPTGGWNSRDPSAASRMAAHSPIQPPRAHRSTVTPISQTLLRQLPDGDRPSMTNSRRFEFDYDVDAVGRDGVARIELYRTDDAGRTWKLDRKLDNPDPSQPLQVNVDKEGVYGYRVVVVARNGFASRRPGAGDQADLWIGVDLTKPEVRLTGAVYGKNEHAGKLAIRWDAHDALFGERPVTLRFSESPDGPWATIASGLPNSGEYFWTADPRTPELIYLRIEVHDAAGNRSADQLERPIRIEGLVPRGRIRGFRAVNQP